MPSSPSYVPSPCCSLKRGDAQQCSSRDHTSTRNSMQVLARWRSQSMRRRRRRRSRRLAQPLLSVLRLILHLSLHPHLTPHTQLSSSSQQSNKYKKQARQTSITQLARLYVIYSRSKHHNNRQVAGAQGSRLSNITRQAGLKAQ